MHIQPVKTRIFSESQDFLAFILAYIPAMPERSILVVTSKIVALSEGRTARVKNRKMKEELIRAESEVAIPTKYTWLTIKNGIVMASAGIDESNGNGKLVLLPWDSFASARKLRKALLKKYRIKNLGEIGRAHV